MKISKQIRRLALMAVSAGLIAVSAARLGAFNPQPDPPAFGLIGMYINETSRFNVSCPNATVNGVQPGPCVGTMQFLDAQGGIMKSASYNLLPGQTMSFDLLSSEVRFGGDGRAEFQACLIPMQGRALPSLEVFDVNTGKTDVFAQPATPRLGLIKNLTGG